MTHHVPTSNPPWHSSPWMLVAVGLAAMYGVTFHDLFVELWSTEQQGHGPIVFALSLWLLWRTRPAWNALPDGEPRPAVAWPLIVTASLFYAIGRSQSIYLLEVGSLIPMLVGVVLLLASPQHLRLLAFPLFFMVFMIPLPGSVVDAMTQPMKLAVSYVAQELLLLLGYPIARSGVILQIGPYQLLVADACAGLHTLFTLEALGLLYLNVVRVASAFRNITLAILIVPISFSANVVRVIILSLITYHLGDEAGQGFLHGFAGMVLFMTALLLIMATDGMLRWLSQWRDAQRHTSKPGLAG